jgi:hypothetical protein
MKRMQVLSLLLGLSLASSAALVNAQGTTDKQEAAPTRSQIKMERDEFLRTHRWEEGTELWALKSGIEPPTGVKSRREVTAVRDDFLRNNRWDESSGRWVSLEGAPRDMGTMSREQVRIETAQFTRTHRWDEITDAWVSK